MNKTIALAFAISAGLVAASAAHGQTTAPDFPTSTATAARPMVKPPLDAARLRRQQQMSPEDAARDQQLQVMEARTGNTSFGMERGGPARQQDKSTGGFTVRKFRELPGQEQQKGTTRRVQMGARTTGQPLEHKHKTKHKFLFF